MPFNDRTEEWVRNLWKGDVSRPPLALLCLREQRSNAPLSLTTVPRTRTGPDGRKAVLSEEDSYVAPDRRRHTISKINGYVCPVLMPGGIQCGKAYPNRATAQAEMRRHFRQEHPGTVAKTTRLNISFDEESSGRNALIRYVLTRQWRFADVHGHQGRAWLLNGIAKKLEEFAEQDEEFKRLYGSRFVHQTVERPTDNEPGPLAPQQPLSLEHPDCEEWRDAPYDYAPKGAYEPTIVEPLEVVDDDMESEYKEMDEEAA
ncbi:hypothetical protein B0T20DRAFT_498657 [Sordaria brevicollis]|uniref:Uncharacterized protein n=1 Tax=Sordaria brevicollis TaxID=83679 RepID=A0AAE0PEY3_SORBR|nr:hypothetical protein B0T20DRAFT_498657 [Sordaria brevicollis]